MSAPGHPEAGPLAADRFRGGVTVAFFLGVALVAGSGDSFWIDECITAEVARPANLLEGWRAMVRVRFAEVQMPLFIAWTWAWEKIFGSSERALRLAGLPFFLAGMTLLVTAGGRALRSRAALALVMGFSPFVWYYLNEARLYTMQLGATAAVIAATFQLARNEVRSDPATARWQRVWLAGLVTLSAISMLGQLWAGAAILALLLTVPAARAWGWWRPVWGSVLAAVAGLAVLGGYYLWSLSIGARATTVGQTNWQTVLFIFYEQLGFAGTGPGRNELREAGVAALKPFLPGLMLQGGLTAVVLAAGLHALAQSPVRRKLPGLAIALALPAGFILLAGVVLQFRVLGRHFAPLAPVWWVILGLGVTALWTRRAFAGHIAVIAFLVVSQVSSFQLRFADRHQKDDYRRAAIVARAALAQGRTVWWNAAATGALYYQVPLAESGPAPGRAWLVGNPDPRQLAEASPPDCIITSKPDVHDAQGAVAAFVRAHAYRLVATPAAFQIWERQ